MATDQPDKLPDFTDSSPSPTIDGLTSGMPDKMVIPLISEELHIDKRWVESGRTRLVKDVKERSVPVSIDLLREETEVERVSINKQVDVAPPIRYEGDVMIIPILKEEYVIVKQLMLVEEVRVIKRQTTETITQTVTLRSEEMRVEQTKTDPTLQDSIS